MIDEDRTMQLYGYTSDELSAGSGKPVVIVCEECGKYRVSSPSLYNRRILDGNLCISCSNQTDEKREIMRTKGFSRRHTEEELIKMSVSQLGEKNHNWKGGITPWRSKMWFTPVYKKWRSAIFERDNYTCQICNERGGNLEAHHIHPIRDNKNNLSVFDINNGITLCKKCHMSINNGRDVEYIEMFEDIINDGGRNG